MLFDSEMVNDGMVDGDNLLWGLIVIANHQSDMDNRLFHFNLNLICCLG
jgi:hypothetical protein